MFLIILLKLKNILLRHNVALSIYCTKGNKTSTKGCKLDTNKWLEVTPIKKIRQSNDFIESPYAQEFTAHEIKIFEVGAAGITSEDVTKAIQRLNKRYSLSSNQLASLLNTSVSVISHEIEKTAKKIMKKTIHLRKTLEDGTVEFEMINIIPYARYKNGVFEFDLNYAIIPYLVEINKNFTEYQLHYLLSLKSAYSIKIYKLLYQYKNIKSRTFKVADIKEQCGLADKYPQYKNFKQRIIVPSIAQINELTDLHVTFNEIKLGRSVDKIEFHFKLKDKPIHSDFIDKEMKTIDLKLKESNSVIVVSENSDLETLLMDIKSKLSEKTRKLINKTHKDKGIDFVEASIKYATKNAKSNFDKYLYDTLTNNWAEVELQKILDKKINTQKQLQISRQKQKEQEDKLQSHQQNITKIRFEWNNLTQSQRELYTCHANNILKKHNQKLSIFTNILEDLPICCYAVSQNKSYDLTIEGFCKNVLNLHLSVNQ